MSKKYEPERITKEYLLVVEYLNTENNEILNYEKLITNLKIIAEFYAIILHDKDDTRKHYHITIKLNKRMRKQTLLKHIANFNQIPLEMIQIEYMENFILSIRYMLHLDNPEKYQYPPFLINTNSYHQIERIIETEIYPNEITAKQLLYYIYDKKLTNAKILEIIGLKNFNKYARTIAILKDEQRENQRQYLMERNLNDDEI